MSPSGTAGSFRIARAEDEQVDRKEDGRTLRSASTRRAVAEAYLNLVNAGDIRPPAPAPAAAAGAPARAAPRHFQDMETLHAEAAVLQIQRVTRDIPDLAPQGATLAERADGVARRWCTLNERVSPVRRVALLYEPFSPEIARRLSWVRGVTRAEVEKAFESELGAMNDETRRRTTAALSATAAWETWNELRRRHDLDIEVATRTVAAMMLAILSFFPG